MFELFTPCSGGSSGPLVSFRAAHDFRQLGNIVPFVLLTLAVAGFAALLGDWLAASVSVAAPVLAVVLTEYVCKPLFNRASVGAPSFPSGHTAAMSALAASLVLVAARRWGWRGLAVALVAAMLLSGSMVLAVVRVHAHYMSDGLAGVVLGLAVVLWAALVASAAVDQIGWWGSGVGC